ncbi:unnamed protein product, partial [Brenthis ino]
MVQIAPTAPRAPRYKERSRISNNLVDLRNATMSSEKNYKPTVVSKVGVIRGVKANDGSYDMFMGIPFGRVLEDNPFGIAAPYPKFDHIFDANDDSAASPQQEEYTHTIIGSLDCLHLNIYVPHSKTPLAVIIWIFGGRYAIGFPGRFIYGPKYFMANQVILVTMNYRQGPYGFLCTNTPKIPGNQGLKDILLGLRWVKDNISEFGGDVNNITVFGESSGAMAIDLFLTLDETLFHKAILMSGTALRPLVVKKYDHTIQIRLAERLGFKTKDPNEAVAFLAKIHPHLVIKASEELRIIYRPCIEKNFEEVEQLIPNYPIRMPLKNLKGIPIMAGFCDAETMYRHYLKTPDEFGSDIIKIYLDTIFDLDNHRWAKDIVRQFYLGDEEFSREMLWEIIDFDSDISFIHPMQRRIKQFIENGAKVYQYLFKYCGDRNFVKKRARITEGGACHADEIAYLFDISYEETPSKTDQLVIDRMTAMWANFAKYGDPTPVVSPLLPLKWSPLTADHAHCMVIDSELTTISRPFHDRMAFWDLFYKVFGHKLRDLEK